MIDDYFKLIHNEQKLKAKIAETIIYIPVSIFRPISADVCLSWNIFQVSDTRMSIDVTLYIYKISSSEAYIGPVMFLCRKSSSHFFVACSNMFNDIFFILGFHHGSYNNFALCRCHSNINQCCWKVKWR